MAKKTGKSKSEVKVTKEFLFKLSEEESNEKGKAAAKLKKEVDALSLQFEDAKESWKAKIKTRQDKMLELLDIVNAQEEKRTVEATMIRNYDEKTIEYRFKGKVVETRDMTTNEFQGELPFGKSKRPAAAKQEFKSGTPVGATSDSEIADVHRLETRRATKKSAVDGPTL